MQAFVEFVVKRLVDHPDEVDVTAVESEGQTIFELRLNPDDIGRVVGRRGNTINALRTLLNAGSSRADQRCLLEIVEDPRRETAGE